MIILDNPPKFPFFAVVGGTVDVLTKTAILRVAVLTEGQTIAEIHALTLMDGDGQSTTASTGLRAGKTQIAEEFQLNVPDGYTGFLQTLEQNNSIPTALETWAISRGILPLGKVQP